jgi:hypothetical protein
MSLYVKVPHIIQVLTCESKPWCRVFGFVITYCWHKSNSSNALYLTWYQYLLMLNGYETKVMNPPPPTGYQPGYIRS